MMLATVGTGPQGFDRLIRGVDAIAPELDESITAQIGRGEYEPENIEWFRFTSEEEIHELYRAATVVIAHAGAGTLLTAFSYDTPVIVVPRREQRGEHYDDHQMEIATALENHRGIQVVLETDDLKPAVERARAYSGIMALSDRSLVQFLSKYINRLEQ